jgi:hypothetical protein
MIMWHSRIIIASVVALAALTISSCGPNLDNLDLSGCTKECNKVARQCLDDANARLDACVPDDALCQRQALHDSEACLTSCLDCLSVCIEETEDQLKD